MSEKKLPLSLKSTEEIVASLQSHSIFAALSEIQLKKIAPLVSWHNFSNGDTILKQDQANSRLYFLVQGELGGFVDGEQVSVFRRTCDVIGAMSVISSWQASATIRALTPSELFSIEAKDFSCFAGSLASICPSADGQFKQVLDSLQRGIERLRVLIEPLTAASNSEVGLTKQKVLLLEPNIKEQVIAKMALDGIGVKLDIAADMATGLRLIEQNDYDMVFTGIKLVELTRHAQLKNPGIKIVFLTSEDIPNYLLLLERYPSISNVVSFGDEDRSFTIKSITTTVSKLGNQDLFGLEKYISWGAEISEALITGSAHRKKIIKDMEKNLLSIGIRRSVISRVSAVSEELLMNAIYDAPVDKDGKCIYNHLPRTVKIELKPNERGLFRFACDGLIVAISVTDPFGALTQKTVVRYLRNCYGTSPGTLNSISEHKGGAGMGLFQLMATSDLVVFNVHAGRKTEVIALFSTDPKLAKERKKPSFHFFYR